MIPIEIKKIVRNRVKECCEYCVSQENFGVQSFSVEHIFPLSKGGTDDLQNLALSCQGCNNHKYNKTSDFDIVSAEYVELFNPRIDIWTDHFGWNFDCYEIIGLTPIGRITVNALNMNRLKVKNLRKVLYKANLHPPSF